MKYILTCNSGLEALTKKEILNLGYNITKTSDGLIFFEGDESCIANVNIWSRIGNKLYLIIENKNNIKDFDSLYNLIHKIDWNKYITDNQEIIVNANSIKSQLSSIPTIQSVGLKSIINKLTGIKDTIRNTNGIGGTINILIIINNNNCYVLLNTTGDSLHKRGYKTNPVIAPIKENLAAGLIKLTDRNIKKDLYDFFAGSGTIPIEACLIAKNIAPGKFRSFAFENFQWYDNKIKTDIIEKAVNEEISSNIQIVGYDIDYEVKQKQINNAQNAGVDKFINFETKNFLDLDINIFENIHFVSNPPYGNRISSSNIKDLYRKINKFFDKGKNISGGIITSYNGFYNMIESKNYKLRKLFNGGEKCHLYWYKLNN